MIFIVKFYLRKHQFWVNYVTEIRGSIGYLFLYFMGITPLFYRLLPGAEPLELLAQRVIWSLPFLLAIRLRIKNKTLWQQVWADKRSIILCLFSSSIMAISWGHSLMH